MTYLNNQRWLRGINISGEVIPPYSVVGINQYPVTESSDGELVFKLFKPNDNLEWWQLGAFIGITGPDPIQPDRDGEFTQDYPAICRLSKDARPPKMQLRYGPKADSWELHAKSGGAFSPIGQVRSPDGKPGLLLVSGTTIMGYGCCGVLAKFQGAIVHDEPVPVTLVEPTDNSWINGSGSGVSRQEVGDGYALIPEDAGIYLVGCSVNVRFANVGAPQTAELRLRSIVDEILFNGYASAPVTAPQTADESYPQDHQLFISHPLFLEAGDGVYPVIKLSGGADVTAIGGYMVLAKISPPFIDADVPG